MAEQRIGPGFDVHPRALEPRRVLLGGAAFEGVNGLAGHSDGDVVCHALADALLGASGLGDVGEHFPEDDPKIRRPDITKAQTLLGFAPKTGIAEGLDATVAYFPSGGDLMAAVVGGSISIGSSSEIAPCRA